MRARFETLLILGGNPVFDMPFGYRISRDGLKEGQRTSAQLSLYQDETPNTAIGMFRQHTIWSRGVTRVPSMGQRVWFSRLSNRCMMAKQRTSFWQRSQTGRIEAVV